MNKMTNQNIPVPVSVRMQPFKPYKKYKPSGIAWLGDIPEHWEVRKLKYAVTINDETLAESTEKQFIFDYIDIESVREGEILKRKKMTFETSPSRARRIVKNGDVIVSTVRTYLKAIVQINDLKNTTIVSTGFAVLRPSGLLREEFLNYCVRAKHFIEKVVANSTGVGYPAITATRLSNIEAIIPLLPEQTTIANFLDYKTEKINRFIQKKKQLIKLLNEQKAGIINDAVTKGLNPNAAMKDSGIEWLGDIPEHWEVKPLKYFVTHNDEALSNSTDKEYELNYIDIGNVDSNGDIEEIVKYKFKDAPSRARRIVRVGDVIISTVRTYLKAIAIIENDLDVIVSTGFAVLRPRKNINGEFLNYVVRANYFIEDVCSNSFGVSYPAINSSELVTLKLVVPKSEIEQKNIVEFIKNESKKIDKTIATIEKEITLVEEYKTVLIAEAVTGKIDVRDFKMPQEETPLAMVAEEAANYNSFVK